MTTKDEYYLIFIEKTGECSPSFSVPQEYGKLFFIRRERVKNIVKTKIKEADNGGHLESGKPLYICISGSKDFKEDAKEAAGEEIGELKKFARIVPKEFDSIDELPRYLIKPINPEVQTKKTSGKSDEKHPPTIAEKIRECLPKGSKLSDSDIYVIILSMQQVSSSELSPCTPLTQYEYFKMLVGRYAVGDGRAEKIIKEVEEGDNVIGKIAQILGKEKT